jgi:choline dehydrogenase-like flavoprotein
MPTYESDVCIIGSGISAAMLAEKLAEKRPGLAVTVVEAGRALFDVGSRIGNRDRSQRYGESAWPEDIIEDQLAEGIICHTMAVGGQALRWGGACNRFSQEDLRLHFDVDLQTLWDFAPPGLAQECICGDIMAGIKSPHDCTLFGKACVPHSPVGACMVSSEGTCRIWYQYGGHPDLGIGDWGAGIREQGSGDESRIPDPESRSTTERIGSRGYCAR